MTTLYVAPNGADSGINALGTADKPFLSIQVAANKMQPGDTVQVRPGNYTGFNLGWDTPKSGWPGKLLNFVAEPGVFITHWTKSQDGIDLEGASYVSITGFNINGMLRSGIRTNNGRDIRLYKNICTNNKVWGIQTSHVDDLIIQDNSCYSSQQQHGIYVGNACSNARVINNIASNNKNCGIHINGDQTQGGDGTVSRAIISGNICSGNGAGGGAAINCDGLSNSLIEDNLLIDNLNTGIALFRIDAATPARDNVISNNTVIQAESSKNPAILFRNGSIRNKVSRNIFFIKAQPTVNTGQVAFNVDPYSFYQLFSDNNAINGNFSLDDMKTFLSWTGWKAATLQDSNSLMTQFISDTSMLVNYGLADYPYLGATPVKPGRAPVVLPIPPAPPTK